MEKASSESKVLYMFLVNVKEITTKLILNF